MKQIIIPAAIAAALLLAGWQAPAATTTTAAPEIHYGAKKKDAKDSKKKDAKKKDSKKKDADAEDDEDVADDTDVADEVDDSKGKAKKGKKADMKLGEAAKELKGVKFFNGKPNLKAKYFIYFQASAENLHSSNMMDDIMTEYKKMKKDGRVEIIYVGHDRNASEAKKFLRQNKAKFPGLHKDDQAAQELPGFAPSVNIPNVIIINAKGEVIAKGDGAIITTGEWKGKTIDSEAENDDSEE